MGTSIKPVELTLPRMVYTLVPGLEGVPKLRYHLAPWRRMAGILARVSTLFTRVGLFHSPLVVG